MASPETPRLLESPSDIKSEIDRRLGEDGLSPQCPDEEKLLYVWRLYQTVESDLQVAIENEEKLKRAQTEEMQEVENYVEHIRHLSDEREALIQELETENDQLKQELERMRQEQNASGLREETAEMLIQQGLEEIANAPSSEQIAFLLVERARLLDELEAEQVRTLEEGRMSADLQRTLDDERSEFEKELGQQRESIKTVKETLKHEHEEELNILMDENNKLEEELKEAKEKVSSLETRLQNVEEELKKEKEQKETKEGFISPDPRASPRQRPPSPARSPSDVALRQIIAEKTKIEGEILTHKSRIRTLDTENTNLREQIKKFEGELEKSQMMTQQLQMKNRSLKTEIEELEQQLDESETQLTDAKQEKNHLQGALENVQAENVTLKAEVLNSNLKEDVERLNSENLELSDKLETLKRELDNAVFEKDELATQKLQLSKSEIELTNEVHELKLELNQIKNAKEELESNKDELAKTQTLLSTKTEELEKLNVDTEMLSKENKELLNRLESVQKDFEVKKVEGQELAKQEIIVTHMRDQNNKLSKDLNEAKEELSKVKTELTGVKDELSGVQQELSETKQDLNKTKQDLDKKQKELNEVEQDLNKFEDDLATRNEELTEARFELTEANTELTEVNAELTEAKEDLKKAQQDIEKWEEDLEETDRRYKKEIEDLKAKLQLALNELTKAKNVVEQERSESSELTARVLELEQLLEDSSRASDSKSSNMSELEAKVKELELLVKEKVGLEDELEEERRKILQYERQVEELESLKIELEDSRDMIDQEKRSKSQLEMKLQEIEQLLDDQRLESESVQQNLTSKVKSLENRVQALQDDLFTAQDELQASQEKHEKLQEELRASQMSLQEKIHKEVVQTHQLSAAPPPPKSEESDTVAVRLETQKIQNLEKQIEAMKIRLSESQKQVENITKERDALLREIRLLRESTKKFEVKTEDHESMRKELDAVTRELEHLRTSAEYDSEERQQHQDRIKTLEDYTRRLELDNRELANKLSETLVKYEQAEEQIQREKRNTVDRQQKNSRQLHQAESDLEAANNKLRELREEVQKKQNDIIKLESDKVGQLAKSESTIARLEAELNDLKQYHRKELDKLSEKVEHTSKESKELRNHLRDRDQEILSKQHEQKRTKATTERLEAQLQTEIKIRTDLENRNTALDQEISKVWGQVRALMEKNGALETAKRNLEDELSRKNMTTRHAESTYVQNKVNQEATIKAVQNRAESAEKRADHLQRELQETSMKLQTVQSQLYQAENCKTDLLEKKDQVTTLKNQLEGEKLQRSLSEQSVKELQQQNGMMRQREAKVLEQNRELQHTIVDLESKLEEIHDRSQNAIEMETTKSWVNTLDSNQHQHVNEVGKRSMMDQIMRLQKDIKDLQYELLSVNERREVLDRKYEERKVRTKAKLLKASRDDSPPGSYEQRVMKEYYSKDKSRMNDHLRRMEEDLRLTRSTLRKELDWKDKMDNNYKQLLNEKRELLTQLNEQEEITREKSRMVSILQVRTKFLEEENSRLQDRVDSVTHQKHGLDKLLKEQRANKERESSNLRPLSPGDNPQSLTAGTSGLGNSVNSSWDQDHLVDAMLNYRTPSSDQAINGYLGRNTYTSAAIDLYRGETESESSYGHEFDA